MIASAFKGNQVKSDPEQAQWKADLMILEIYFRERAF